MIWLASVSALLVGAVRYQATPGQPANAPGQWPVSSTLTLDAHRPTVVMLAHPRCPCTRASLGELARLMSELGDCVAVHVLFIKPPGSGPGWDSTDTVAAARRIRGVDVRIDEGGVESTRFGAMTSGQVLAFSPDGTLEFSGGITAGRDHAGDNLGHALLRTFLMGNATGSAHTDVFGCPLRADASPAAPAP